MKMLYKGCQKRMIMLKNTGSEIFDEAYFIIKDSAQRRGVSETDMVREANRIIEEKIFCPDARALGKGRLKPRLKTALWYAAGAVSGAGVIGILGMF